MARRQVAALRWHYRQQDRPEAARNLTAALRAVSRLIAIGNSLESPRPYPELAAPGRAWVHAAPYWIAYATTRSPEIVAVFYDQADIPGRV